MTQAIAEISNTKMIDPMISIGGQPTIEQLAALSREGFDVIIQINVEDAPNHIKNEAYHADLNSMAHFGVDMSYSEPDIEDVYIFCDLLNRNEDKRVFVHCADGFFASTLLVIYKMLTENIALEDAMASYTVPNWHVNDRWFELLKDIA